MGLASLCNIMVEIMGNSITFLFGAGAEGKGQFEMPSGADFKKDLIVPKGVKSFSEAVLSKTDYRINDQTLLSWNSTSVLYQAIIESDSNEEDVINNLFKNEKDKRIAREYLLYKKSSLSDSKNDPARDFLELYKSKFYDRLKINDSIEEYLRFFLDIAGVYSYFDSLFNYLRKPECYKKEVTRVMKLYYAAFLSLYRRLIDESGLVEYNNIFEGKESNRETIRISIDEMQNAIIEKNASDNKETYYNAVKQLVNKTKRNSDLKVRIVTTNYTEFSERITGICSENIAYMHGKLGLFESLYSKRIAYLDEFKDNKEPIFPYLLVQSGVKPIINRRQIQEVNKGNCFLYDADELIIIGYGLNSDDEHIINVIRERLVAHKKTKIFLHTNNDTDEKDRICTLLRDNGAVSFERSSVFNDYVESMC